MKALSSDREISALKTRTVEYDVTVSGVRGLQIRVRTGGSKTFYLRYRTPEGLRRRMTLGEYPTLSLSEARLMASEVRLSVLKGSDPAAERAATRDSLRFGETINDLADRFMEAAERGLHGGRGRPLAPSTLTNYKINLDKHIRPIIGDRKFSELKRRDIKAYMHRIAASGIAGATVARIGGVLLALYSYAIHMDLLESNPVLGLTRPVAVVSRERMFTERELRKIWRAVNDQGSTISEEIRLAMQLTILTLSRRSEVCGAEWDEIDFNTRTWIMPSSRIKQRRAHVVPLSPQVIRLLSRAREFSNGSRFIFPSPRNDDKPIDAHAMSRALTRLCERLELPHRSPHDFRRTAATIMTSEALGVRRFVVSWLLGHSAKEGAVVTQVYDRNQYLLERRQALTDWANFLDKSPRHLEPDEPGNVVSLLRLA